MSRTGTTRDDERRLCASQPASKLGARSAPLRYHCGMIEPRHPYPPYQRAPVPVSAAKAGLPTWLILGIVIGGGGMLGVGGLAVIGAIWYLSEQRPDTIAKAERTVDSGATADGDAGAKSELARSAAADDRAEEPGAQGAGPNGEQATVSPTPNTERRVASHGSETKPSENGAHASGTDPSPGSTAPSSANWWCTASASVRVCGFAGACNYQMVFGNGGGKDRFLASQQAKNACQASARAKGATAVCVVQCSVR